VQVQVLLDGTADGSMYSERDPLCAAGITVRVEGWTAKLHDKYAVIDAGTASDPQVVTGSVNWTDAAVSDNDENLVVVRNGTIAADYAADWARLKQATGMGSFACNVTPSPSGAQVFVPVVQTTPSPTPTPTPSPASGRAEITYIDYAPTGETLEEYVRIQNLDPTPITLTNWTLSDATGNTFRFPAFTLGGHAEVRVWTNSGTHDVGNLYWGRGQAVWNNDGDTAYLKRPDGNVADIYTYP
jgi:hypothetical protein